MTPYSTNIRDGDERALSLLGATSVSVTAAEAWSLAWCDSVARQCCFSRTLACLPIFLRR